MKSSSEGKKMKKFLVVSMAFVTCMAFAHNCPNEIKAIDAKMTTAKLSAADSAKVKAGPFPIAPRFHACLG